MRANDEGSAFRFLRCLTLIYIRIASLTMTHSLYSNKSLPFERTVPNLFHFIRTRPIRMIY
jgi:hypothetical protein